MKTFIFKTVIAICFSCSLMVQAQEANSVSKDATKLTVEDLSKDLFYAVRYNDVDLVQDLLSKSADPNVRDDSGQTPLMHVSCKGIYGREEIITNMLLSAGALVNIQNYQGNTALMFTVSCSKVNLTNLLLSAGADPNIANKNSWTPLYPAVLTDNLDIVNALLAANADPDIAKKNGWTPLHEAVGKENLDIVKALLAANADPDIANNDGWTPLYLAVIEENLDIVKALLAANADPDIAENDGWTPRDRAKYSSKAIKDLLYQPNFIEKIFR